MFPPTLAGLETVLGEENDPVGHNFESFVDGTSAGSHGVLLLWDEGSGFDRGAWSSFLCCTDRCWLHLCAEGELLEDTEQYTPPELTISVLLSRTHFSSVTSNHKHRASARQATVHFLAGH